MPYYEIIMSGGEREERRAIRETFNGREADYTGHEVIFYVTAITKSRGCARM